MVSLLLLISLVGLVVSMVALVKYSASTIEWVLMLPIIVCLFLSAGFGVYDIYLCINLSDEGTFDSRIELLQKENKRIKESIEKTLYMQQGRSFSIEEALVVYSTLQAQTSVCGTKNSTMRPTIKSEKECILHFQREVSIPIDEILLNLFYILSSQLDTYISNEQKIKEVENDKVDLPAKKWLVHFNIM